MADSDDPEGDTFRTFKRIPSNPVVKRGWNAAGGVVEQNVSYPYGPMKTSTISSTAQMAGSPIGNAQQRTPSLGERRPFTAAKTQAFHSITPGSSKPPQQLITELKPQSTLTRGVAGASLIGRTLVATPKPSIQVKAEMGSSVQLSQERGNEERSGGDGEGKATQHTDDRSPSVELIDKETYFVPKTLKRLRPSMPTGIVSGTPSTASSDIPINVKKFVPAINSTPRIGTPTSQDRGAVASGVMSALGLTPKVAAPTSQPEKKVPKTDAEWKEWRNMQHEKKRKALAESAKSIMDEELKEKERKAREMGLLPFIDAHGREVHHFDEEVLQQFMSSAKSVVFTPSPAKSAPRIHPASVQPLRPAYVKNAPLWVPPKVKKPLAENKPQVAKILPSKSPLAKALIKNEMNAEETVDVSNWDDDDSFFDNSGFDDTAFDMKNTTFKSPSPEKQKPLMKTASPVKQKTLVKQEVDRKWTPIASKKQTEKDHKTPVSFQSPSQKEKDARTKAIEEELMRKKGIYLNYLPTTTQIQQMNVSERHLSIENASKLLEMKMVAVTPKPKMTDKPPGQLTTHVNTLIHDMRKDILKALPENSEIFQSRLPNLPINHWIKKKGITEMSAEEKLASIVEVDRKRREKEEKKRARMKKALKTWREDRFIPDPRTPPGSPRPGSPAVSTMGVGSRANSPGAYGPRTPDGSPPSSRDSSPTPSSRPPKEMKYTVKQPTSATEMDTETVGGTERKEFLRPSLSTTERREKESTNKMEMKRKSLTPSTSATRLRCEETMAPVDWDDSMEGMPVIDMYDEMDTTAAPSSSAIASAGQEAMDANDSSDRPILTALKAKNLLRRVCEESKRGSDRGAVISMVSPRTAPFAKERNVVMASGKPASSQDNEDEEARRSRSDQWEKRMEGMSSDQLEKLLEVHAHAKSDILVPSLPKTLVSQLTKSRSETREGEEREGSFSFMSSLQAAAEQREKLMMEDMVKEAKQERKRQQERIFNPLKRPKNRRVLTDSTLLSKHEALNELSSQIYHAAYTNGSIVINSDDEREFEREVQEAHGVKGPGTEKKKIVKKKKKKINRPPTAREIRVQERKKRLWEEFLEEKREKISERVEKDKVKEERIRKEKEREESTPEPTRVLEYRRAAAKCMADTAELAKRTYKKRSAEPSSESRSRARPKGEVAVTPSTQMTPSEYGRSYRGPKSRKARNMEFCQWIVQRNKRRRREGLPIDSGDEMAEDEEEEEEEEEEEDEEHEDNADEEEESDGGRGRSSSAMRPSTSYEVDGATTSREQEPDDLFDWMEQPEEEYQEVQVSLAKRWNTWRMHNVPKLPNGHYMPKKDLFSHIHVTSIHTGLITAVTTEQRKLYLTKRKRQMTAAFQKWNALQDRGFFEHEAEPVLDTSADTKRKRLHDGTMARVHSTLPPTAMARWKEFEPSLEPIMGQYTHRLAEYLGKLARDEAERIVKHNESIITQQMDYIGMQKKLLDKFKDEIVDTLKLVEEADKQFREKKMEMLGECESWEEYKKLSEAREHLMNFFYETTMEKMKKERIDDGEKKRIYDVYKRKFAEREKKLEKELKKMTDRLAEVLEERKTEKAAQRDAEKNRPKEPRRRESKKPFSTTERDARNKRLEPVLEAMKSVWGPGIEGDEAKEKEQNLAIINALRKKFGMAELKMTVEQDKKFCVDLEIPYRKRTEMKKCLAEMGMDIFCSQRAYDGRKPPGERKPKIEGEKRVRKTKVKLENPGEISLRSILEGREDGDDEREEFDETILEEIEIDEGEEEMELDVTGEGGTVSMEETVIIEDMEYDVPIGDHSYSHHHRRVTLTSDEEYIEESDQDQPGPSNRYYAYPQVPVLPPPQYAPSPRGGARMRGGNMRR